MPIEKLSEHVIAQIAAGEVVERPSSVVKELIENSLDAGATHIAVEIDEGGRKLIRVVDDGVGIRSDEVMLALARHATSKLRSAEDLNAIQTLGFRGEALFSIVAVSRTTLITRHRSEQAGVELRVEGGDIRYTKGRGVPAGTSITVENLFFNTPARLKFLKAESTEKRQIINLIHDYAMAYPHVRFILVHDGREVFRSTGTGQMGDVVVKVFGLDVFKQMLEIYGEETIQSHGDKIIVRGFVTSPDMNRNDRSRIVLFVNGRSVQDSSLAYGVAQAYHMLMEKGRYPYAVVMLQVPTDFVDVNVHPTKAEVRFQDPNITFVAVQRTIRESLMRVTRLGGSNVRPSVSTARPATANTLPEQIDMGFDVPERARSRATNSVADDDLSYIPEGAGRPAKPRTLPILRVVGQLMASYIIAEGPAGLYLLDQYAVSERVLFDELLESFDQLADTVHTINGVTIDLTVRQFQMVEAHFEDLARVGVLVEPFGATTLVIRTIPQVVAPRDALELLGRMVVGIERGDQFPQDYLLRIAQVGAHKSGQSISLDLMQSLIRKLERCPEPFNSPSGTPTLLHMSAEQLAREFNKRS